MSAIGASRPGERLAVLAPSRRLERLLQGSLTGLSVGQTRVASNRPRERLLDGPSGLPDLVSVTRLGELLQADVPNFAGQAVEAAMRQQK